MECRVSHGIYIHKHVKNPYPALWIKDAGHNEYVFLIVLIN